MVVSIAQTPSMAPTSTAFEMTQPTASEMVMQPDAVVPSNKMISVAKHEKTSAHDHFDHAHAHARWDDNWYALLAEFHVQEQRKKDKWHGQDDGDDWLAEFEKLALLELRK